MNTVQVWKLDVALDDGSENLVLLTNVMFQNLCGTEKVKEPSSFE